MTDRSGLRRVARMMAQYADGRVEEVDVTGPLVITIVGRRTADEAPVSGNQVLLGQSALQKLDLLIGHHRQRLVPNPAHPDRPVFRV